MKTIYKSITIRIPIALYLAFRREMLDRQEQGQPITSMTKAALDGMRTETEEEL